MNAVGNLSNLQLEIIKLFQYEISDNQLLEIRDLLVNYFAQKATEEMDTLWDENNWSDETMDYWADEHLRTAYE